MRTFQSNKNYFIGRRGYMKSMKRHLIQRQQQNKGLGTIHCPNWDNSSKWIIKPCKEHARLLSCRQVVTSNESYNVIMFLKLPITVRKYNMEELQRYLHATSVVDDNYCQHEYDCCGHYYPGTARITKRQGQTITIVQEYFRNI